MSLYNSINVKDLPSLEQILAGNYLIVENVNGTNKLDFADFVIGPTNTSFYTSIANDIRSISAKEIVLSSEIDSVSAELTKRISALNNTVTSTVNLFSPENFYYQRLNTFIGSNQTSASMVFTNVNANFTIRKSQFNLQFDGLSDDLNNLFYPNSGFDLIYNWWFLDTGNSTLTLYITTNNRYPGADKLFSATLSYFNPLQ